MNFLTLIGLAPQESSRYSMFETTRTSLSIWPASPMPGAASRVRADLATWPLRYTATGDDLNQVQAKIDADGAEITASHSWLRL